MEALVWTTQQRKINDLIPYEHNPRILSDQKKKELTESIEKFNFVEIPAIDTDNIVIAGHQRLKVMQILGRGEELVDVRVPNRKLTDKEFKEYNVRSNVMIGVWDKDLLEGVFNDIDLSNIGVNIDEIGLPEDMPEDIPGTELEAEEDDYEIPDEIKTDIVLGDIITFEKDGEELHRLMCGDSTDSEQVAKLMDGKKADMVFTDPPYGVSYVGINNPNGKKWDMIKNDDLRGDGLAAFLCFSFKNLYDFSNDNIPVYIWHASSTHMQFEEALKEAGFEIKQQLIWNKGMILGHSDYHWAHEPVLYCKKLGQKTPWYGDRTSKTILRQRRSEISKLNKDQLITIVNNFMNESSVWEIDRERVLNYKHPTQKPITLAGRAITNSSEENHCIFDLFLGSGSTMVASHQLNRKCYGMELDTKYCQVIADRMKQLDETLIIKINGEVWQS